MGRNVGELHQYTPVFTQHAQCKKCPPLEDRCNEVICMQLVTMEWAKQPPYIIRHRVETCNTTLATIFEWYLANTLRLATSVSNNGCSGCPKSQNIALHTQCARTTLGCP